MPEIASSCDLKGFRLHMNNGLGGDVFSEIDSGVVSEKPWYTEHTTSAATVPGSTYLFIVEAYNINGKVLSESAGFVLGDRPDTPTNGPSSDLLVSSTSQLKIDIE